MSFKSIAGALLLLVATTTACIKEQTESYKDIEQRSLKAWVEKYRPELVNNYQENGGYYVELLEDEWEDRDGVKSGNPDSVAITGKDVWVWFDLTARDLQGNIHETRSAALAEQLATYNDHARYVPALRYSGEKGHTLMEGTYLATFNKLNINGEEVEVRYGTKLRLYLPSSITTTTVTTADGGYEGQFVADESKPMIVDLTIYGHVTDPKAYESGRVAGFAEGNGGVCTEHKATTEEAEAESKSLYRRHTTRTEESESNPEAEARVMEFYNGQWHQPVDTISNLLVKYLYSPADPAFNFDVMQADTMKYPGENRYNTGRLYGNNGLSNVDFLVNKALINRFGKGLTTEKEIIDADSLHKTTEAKVWYIGRFLDGFIFDTNIDEVKEIIYGNIEKEGEAIEFETKEPLKNKYILAWNYSLPTLRYNQWAVILTTSSYGYGVSGQVGSHTTQTTYSDNYYNYVNMTNMYYNNYANYGNYGYGYGGYGNMYNNGYYGYNDPYYYGSGFTLTEDDIITTSLTTTEIPAYSPLLFQVFIEK